MELKKIIAELKAHAKPGAKEGMARFGIKSNKAEIYGVSIPVLRKLAKEIGKDHKLAAVLWKTKIHEARILAGMVEEAEKVTEKQMDSWVKDFDSWDLCDQCCINLFKNISFAEEKIFKYAKSKDEFVKRTAFSLMAVVAWQKEKEISVKSLENYFKIIKEGALDERNFVKKAVNWALRQIGKRNKEFGAKAITLAKEIEKINSKSAKWIAKDAIRELEQKRSALFKN